MKIQIWDEFYLLAKYLKILIEQCKSLENIYCFMIHILEEYSNK